ncbi:MAG: flavodoxin family protein [bacterium]|nr:flavodoxin family protein [bacterium]
MKILAINSSPKMDKGSTAMILTPFLDGLKECGGEVEVLYTKKLNVKHCLADYTCWIKTPGVCVLDDDINSIVLPKVRDADILVLATPLYVDGMSGPMKCLVDRFIPLGQPYMKMVDGHCRHGFLGERHGELKIVLVSACGFWELDNFDSLVAHVRAIAKNLNGEFAGALLRPHASAMRPMIDAGIDIKDIFKSARDAGRELARDGKISQSTLNNISRPLLPLEDYVNNANTFFSEIIEKYKKETSV